MRDNAIRLRIILGAAAAAAVFGLANPAALRAESPENSPRVRQAHAVQSPGSTRHNGRKTSRRFVAATAPAVPERSVSRHPSDITVTPRDHVRRVEDAYGVPQKADGRPAFITGSLVPQTVDIRGNSANSTSPVFVIGQDEIRTRGGDGTIASGLAKYPFIQIIGH